ncbi:MAG: ATP-grasp domain-containing protein [Deltaproteobacteria bacterium]|nr:ATP-grasp domain-containing protein [Deltaproteobacteria bacterium]
MAPPALVFALTGTGMAVVRDLLGTAPRIVGIDADPWRPGRWSRHVHRVGGLSNLPLGEPLLRAVLDFAARSPEPTVLLPAADDACEWLIQHRDVLQPSCRVSEGMRDETAGVLLDKQRFAARCGELGIDVPLTVLPESDDDVRSFLEAAGTPCIVKPRSGHRWRQRLEGQKLIVAETPDHLRRVMDEIVGDPSAVVLQELIPGPESEITVGAVLAREHGGVRHVLTARKMRQFPRNFGSGSWVRTEALPEIAARSAEIVEAFGYHGPCGTEFKYDPRHRRPRLIEINARPTLWFDLCRAAGTHLLRAHYHELAGLPELPIAKQRDGVNWRYLTRDWIAIAQAGKAEGGLRTSWALEQQTPRSDTFCTMAGSDPATVVATFAHTAYQAATHLLGRERDD